MMKATFLLAALLLTGCETAQSDMEKYLPAYQGQPVGKLTQRWGLWTRAVDTGNNRHIYVWENAMPDRNAKVEVQADALDNTQSVRCFGQGEACLNWMRRLR